jgi:hypothetical protein
VQHATIGRLPANGRQIIELIYISGRVGCPLGAFAAFRSMNAAEIVQHRLQQSRPARSSGVDLGRRKFHCVFKGSSGK